jgi:hypothetical protein
VHFNVVDIMWVDTRLVKDACRKNGLRWTVGMRDGDSISRVVGGGTEDDGENPVLFGQGIIQTLDNDRGAAIATAVTIGILVKRGAWARLG